ncbi:MAG: hypothetical protein DWI03_07355 [Planctomycetota bacterium]|jgi:hypothetical protein|nr:MAG: hypothetical protein DWI03_07355 [Planctomycetota bacterium]
MAASAGHPDQPQPGGRGFFRSQTRAVLGAGLVAALLGAAAIPWLLSNPQRLSRFIAGVIPELQADVTLGRVRLGWSGPVVLEDVKVVPRDGGNPPITIERITGSHGLAAILLSAGDVGTLRIEGLEVAVRYDDRQQSNLKGLFAKPADSRPAPGTKPPRRSPVRLRLEVDDAIVGIAGPWTAEPWISDPIDVRAALAPAAGGWSEWTVEPVQLLTQARLEPGVAQGVLAYIAPVLADATRTSGRFSLRLDGARLPVGQPAAGELSGVLSMHEVVVGPGPLVEGMFRSLPGQLAPPPAIRIADESHVAFRLAERRVWHEGLEFGLPLAKPGQRLDVRSQGSVGLDDRSLDLKLSLPIPADLPQDKPLLAALSGKTVSLGVGGVLGQPRIDFDGSIKAAAGQVVTDLIDRIRDGRRPPADPAAPPVPQSQAQPAEDRQQTPAARSTDDTTEAIVDLVGGVLDEVAKRRAERRAAEAANPDAAPPRRGRLRDLLRGPAPAADPTAPPPASAPPPAP